MDARIFVFGSNLAGRHGAGAALWARRERGAIYGQGEGLQGQSYALPTKDHRLQSMSLDIIASHAKRFMEFAASRPDLRFQLTPVGCGLAGYRPAQIGPLFRGAPDNVDIPHEFAEFLK